MNYAIFGLYRDNPMPVVIDAKTKADALRIYHDRHPGWEGATMLVVSQEELDG